MNYTSIVRDVSELWTYFGVTTTYTLPAFFVPFSPFPYMGRQ